MKKFVRARSEDAKTERLKAILKAAIQIVDREGFHALTMDAVAKKCKLAKATLYVYFSNREELLLMILKSDFEQWFERIGAYIKASPAPFSGDFSEVWIAAVKAQPRMVWGLTYLHSQIEPNMNYEFAFRWKTFLRTQIEMLHYQLISRFEPKVSLELVSDFFVSLTGPTIGLWIQSNSGEIIGRVLAENKELSFLKTDFAQTLSVMIEALLSSPKYKSLASLQAGQK